MLHLFCELNVKNMDEKALVMFLGQIMAQQHATQHFLSEAFCGGVLEKKQEILASFAHQKQFYLSKILPELLKGANLDWDPNDLLKE